MSLHLPNPLHNRLVYALLVVLSIMGTSVNAAIYSFTGGPYTTLANFTPPCATGTCGNFDGTMRISGTFTTSVPLPPGLVAQQIRPLITGLHVTDGQTTYDYSDAQLRFRRVDVSTDATGAVTSIDFLVQRWSAPGVVHAPGDRLDMVRLATGSSTAFSNLFCNNVATTVDVDSCQSVNLDSSTSRADGLGGTVLLPQAITFGAQMPALRTFSPGGTFLINPVATSDSGLPTTYSSGSMGICTVSGTIVTMVAAGTCVLHADQPGNVNYSAAAQATQNVAITPSPQAITFGTQAPQVFVLGGTFALSPVAVASSGLPISYTSATPDVCTVASATVSMLAAGNCTITASQAGDGNYLPAMAVSQSVSVMPAAGTINLRSSAPVAAYGAEIILTAQVGGFNPGGTVSFAVNTDGAGLVVICEAVPLSAGSASCVATGNLQKRSPVVYFASYSGDGGNTPAATALQQQVNLNSVTLSAAANPPRPIAGQALTLRALVIARTFTSSVTFYENGIALPTCVNVAVATLPGSTDTGVATCTIDGVTDGSHNYVVTYPHTLDSGFEQVYLFNIVAESLALRDYSGMWWVGPAENGWGMSVTQHGANQFVVLYVYDAAGKPVWYVLPNGNWNASGTAYAGALYQPTSAPFNAYDPHRFKANASVGSLTITYTSLSTARLTYTINGVASSKDMILHTYGSDDGQPKLQVNDLWWGGPGQDGWGLSIAQQGRVLFPVWYTYDVDGRDSWYAVPGGKWSGPTFTGDVYATTSSGWLGTPYNPASFTPKKVGTMTLSFLNQDTASMVYTVNGNTQSKTIFRQPF